MMTAVLRARVAGVTFAHGYPNNLLDLVDRLYINGPIPVELVRDLDNAYDLNAVAVHIEGRHLGHLPADIAHVVATSIDAGATWTARALYVAVDEEHRYRPGLEIEIAKEN